MVIMVFISTVADKLMMMLTAVDISICAECRYIVLYIGSNLKLKLVRKCATNRFLPVNSVMEAKYIQCKMHWTQ